MKTEFRLFANQLVVCALFGVLCVNIGCIASNKTLRQTTVQCCFPNPYWNKQVIKYVSRSENGNKPIAIVGSVLSGWRDVIPHRMVFVDEEAAEDCLCQKLNAPIARVKAGDIQDFFKRLSALMDQKTEDSCETVATFAIWFEDRSPIVFTLDSCELVQLDSKERECLVSPWLNSLLGNDKRKSFDVKKGTLANDNLWDTMRLKVLLGGERYELLTPLETIKPDRKIDCDVLAIVVCRAGDSCAFESVMAMDSEALAYAMKSVGVWQGEVREYVLSHRLMEKFGAMISSATSVGCDDKDWRTCIVVHRSKGLEMVKIAEKKLSVLDEGEKMPANEPARRMSPPTYRGKAI